MILSAFVIHVYQNVYSKHAVTYIAERKYINLIAGVGESTCQSSGLWTQL